MKLCKSATETFECFVRLLKKICKIKHRFLNGMLISRAIEYYLNNRLDDYSKQPSTTKHQKLWRNFGKLSMRTVAKQSMNCVCDMVGIGYANCQEILSENLTCIVLLQTLSLGSCHLIRNSSVLMYVMSFMTWLLLNLSTNLLSSQGL